LRKTVIDLISIRWKTIELIGGFSIYTCQE